MKKIRINLPTWIHIVQYLCIYLLLLLCNGFYIYSQGWALIISFFVSFLMFLTYGISIKKELIYIVVAFVSCVMLSSIVNGDGVDQIVSVLLHILTAVFIAFSCCNYKNGEKFLKSLRKILLIISVFSVIIYFFGIICNNYLDFLPLFNQKNHEAYFSILSFVYKQKQYLQFRNLGICWEPGAFQFYVLLGMLLEYLSNDSKRMRNLFIYTVTMLTTLSSTGIVCLILFWIMFLINEKNLSKRVIIILIGLICISTLFLFPEMLPELVRYELIDKFNALFKGSEELTTVNTRITSIIYPLKAFLNSPIFGVGQSGMTEWSFEVGHSMNTCTEINWFAHYGFFAGLILTVGIIKFFINRCKKVNETIFIIIIFFISISTEAFNYIATVICFSFIGYLNMKKE